MTKEDPADSISYSYDYNNRLTSVQQGTDLTEYLLDASGARVGRVHNAVTNYFVVDQTDGLKRPLAETDANGTVTRYYVWAGMRLICHIDSDGTYRYYHSNELGSTIALTDASGSPTDHFAYMPYGYAKHTGTTDTPFQWLGGYGVYYDADTQLHLTLYRAYSCHLKRFMQADPLGIDGGSNVYMMANLNPLWFIDPYGLCPEDVTYGFGLLDYAEDVDNFLIGEVDALISFIEGAAYFAMNPSEATMAAMDAVVFIDYTLRDIADSVVSAWRSGYRGQGQVVGGALITAAAVAAPFASGPKPVATAPNSPMWTGTKSMTPAQNAYRHFKSHGGEFSQFMNAKQYVEGTQNFLRNPPKGTLTKFRPNGDVLRYHPNSNTFGVMDASGAPRTMFKPSSGAKYWSRQ